ncbi:MAG: FAD-binding protein, partial [Terracidiphilus sp.]
MNKREFLKTAVALAAGNALTHMARGEQAAATPRTNWAGNLTYSTNNLQTPATVDEVRAAVKSASRLRALGARHSFNAIADSTHEQISVARLK